MGNRLEDEKLENFVLFSKQFKDTDFHIMMRQSNAKYAALHGMFPPNKGLGLKVYIGSKKLGVVKFLGKFVLRSIGARYRGMPVPNRMDTMEIQIPFDDFDQWMNDIFEALNKFELKDLLSSKIGIILAIDNRIKGVGDEDTYFALKGVNEFDIKNEISYVDTSDIPNWKDIDWESTSST